MESARIRELLLPFFEGDYLADELLRDVSRYLDLLLKWNARMNLTAVREEENIVIRHFGESFFAARKLISIDSTATIIDVGSGAGFPGVPSKMLRPTASVQLIEAHGKKATFLREVIRTLGLSGVSVRNSRAEDLLEQGTRHADLVTLRAVENFDAVLPTAAKLVAPSGELGLLIGDTQLQVAKQVLAGGWEESIKIPCSSSRILAQWKTP